MLDPLQGCREKINRAKENIGNLNTEITAFLATEPYRIIREHNSDCTEYTLSLIGFPVRARFAVLAGEMLHNLRSALNYLVHALILNENGGKPVKTDFQFPICWTVKDFENACRSGAIKGVSRSARDRIKLLQPYHRPVPDDHPLAILQAYNNFDKHRLLVVVGLYATLAPRVSVITDGPKLTSPDPRYKIKSGRATSTKNVTWRGGATVHIVNEQKKTIFVQRFSKPEPNAHIEVETASDVAFAEFGLAKNQPVVPSLQSILDFTINSIESFLPDF